jgi:hypothetical protein
MRRERLASRAMRTQVGHAALLFCVTLSGCCCDPSKTKHRAPSGGPDVLDDAKQIATAYEVNEVGADNKYLNRRVLITGTITAINQDMSSDEAFLGLRGTSKTDLNLSFGKEWRPGIGELIVGDEIQAECTGDSFHLLEVMMKDCDLKSVPDRKPAPKAKAKAR